MARALVAKRLSAVIQSVCFPFLGKRSKPCIQTIPASELWRELEKRIEMRQPSYISAILVGFEPEERMLLLSQLRQIGVGQTASLSDSRALNGNDDLWSSFDLVLVNHDNFEDCAEAVDTMVQFRKKFPNNRVVLISTQVKGDDFGSERLPICDATLRAPATIERLRASLLA